MQYFDTHTHSLMPVNGQVISIYNIRVCKNIAPPKEGYFSVGIHPYDVEKSTDEWIETLLSIALDARCVAIGEAGIDRRVDNVERQKEIFKIHCTIAKELHKPLIIHCVRSQSEILQLSSTLDSARIFHSYSKVNEEIMRTHNIIYSLSPRNIASSTEILNDQILLETDESTSSIEEVYRQFAIERKMSIEQVGEMVETNFFRTFAL